MYVSLAGISTRIRSSGAPFERIGIFIIQFVVITNLIADAPLPLRVLCSINADKAILRSRRLSLTSSSRARKCDVRGSEMVGLL